MQRMSLSDDVLARPGRKRRLRLELTALVDAVGAESAFLVDEAGEPFAAVGPIEFELPHPVGRLDDGGSLLGALVGEAGDPDEASGLLVARVSPRALLAVALPAGASLRSRRRARREMRRHSPQLERLLLL